MALHTAFGLIAFGVALTLSWRTLPWYREHLAANPGEQIATVGIAWLIVIALVAGIAGFVTMQQRAARNLDDTLSLALRNRVQLFESIIALRADNVASLAARPASTSTCANWSMRRAMLLRAHRWHKSPTASWWAASTRWRCSIAMAARSPAPAFRGSAGDALYAQYGE